MGFFFFFATIWVDLILVSNCGGWFAVKVGCSGGDGGYLCLFFKCWAAGGGSVDLGGGAL